MTQKIIRNAQPNPLRPRMALGLDSIDRYHTPHHLRRYDVEASRLQMGMTFSPVGKWVEVRVEEFFIKAGGKGREQTKMLTTTYEGEDLLALCDFFVEVRKQLAEAGA